MARRSASIRSRSRSSVAWINASSFCITMTETKHNTTGDIHIYSDVVWRLYLIASRCLCLCLCVCRIPPSHSPLLSTYQQSLSIYFQNQLHSRRMNVHGSQQLVELQKPNRQAPKT